MFSLLPPHLYSTAPAFEPALPSGRSLSTISDRFCLWILSFFNFFLCLCGYILITVAMFFSAFEANSVYPELFCFKVET